MTGGIDARSWLSQLRALDSIDGTAEYKQRVRKIRAAAGKIELIRKGCLSEGVPFQEKWNELLVNPPKGFTRDELEEGLEILKQENVMWAEYQREYED